MGVLALDLALVGLLSVPLWVASSVAQAPVAQRRLAGFAHRQGLIITPGNGNHVIAYLAATRRWRAFGLAGGVVVSLLSGLPALTVSSLPLFAGWFVGALVAEFRVLPPRSGPRRVALVSPRRMASYLSRPARLLVPVSGLLAVVIGLIRPMETLWLTIAAVVTALTVLLIQRRVLHRAQPVAQPDVLAADDAIRSRSLHVLAGGGMALVLFLVTDQLLLLQLLGPVPAFVCFAGVSALGWLIATSRRLVVRAG